MNTTAPAVRKSGWSTLTLFSMVIATGVISHIFTLSMVPDDHHDHQQQSHLVPGMLRHLSSSKVRRKINVTRGGEDISIGFSIADEEEMARNEGRGAELEDMAAGTSESNEGNNEVSGELGIAQNNFREAGIADEGGASIVGEKEIVSNGSKTPKEGDAEFSVTEGSKLTPDDGARKVETKRAAGDQQYYRLELLHIPKTGGTALELLAAKHNVTWGACHFEFAWKRRQENPLSVCPHSLRDTSLTVTNGTWHMPLQNLDHLSYNPYDNLADEELAAKPKRFFTVVRNPYSRFISAFYMNCAVEEGPNHTVTCQDSVAVFNAFTDMWLTKVKVDPFFHDGVFRPQFHHVYHEKDRSKLVDHILKFESLEKDFDQLQSQYGLGMKLTKDDVNPTRCPKVRTVSDLSSKNLRRLNDFYMNDFLQFGYELVDPMKSEHDATAATVASNAAVSAPTPPIVEKSATESKQASAKAVPAANAPTTQSTSTAAGLTTSSTQEIAPLSESSWIGTDWYPPRGSKLYDVGMLKNLFNNRKILWIGDAEMKLCYTFLTTLLKGDSSLIEVADLNQIVAPCTTNKALDLCTTVSGATLDFQLANCGPDFLTSQRDVSKYDLIIMGLGAWDMLGMCTHMKSNRLQLFSSVIKSASALGKPVVWTTIGRIDDTAIELNDSMADFVSKSEKRLSLFDFGGGMKQRTDEIFDKNGKKLVFTTAAKMAHVQMLANHLTQFQPA